MGASPQANQNLINTMLAASRLQEVHNANIVNQAAREEQIKLRQQEIIKKRDLNEQAAYDKAFEEQTGGKPTPETVGFYQGTRPLFSPGARSVVGVPGTGETEMTPGGFQIPVGAGAQTIGSPGPQQIAQSFQPGNLARREEVTRTAELAGIPTEGAGFQSVMTQRKTPTFEDVLARRNALIESATKEAGLQKETGLAQKARVEGQVAERTYEPTVAKAGAEAASAEFKRQKDELDANYHPRKLQLEQQAAELDNAIKRGTIARQPVELEHLATETAKARATIRNLDEDYRQKIRVLNGIAEIAKYPPGSPARLQATQNLMVLQGHPGEAAKLSPQLADIYVNTSKNMLEMDNFIEKNAVNNPSDAGYQQSLVNLDQRNNMAIAQAGSISPDAPVRLKTVTPTKNWATGNINGMTFGTTVVDPQLARAYVNKDLENVWRRKGTLPYNGPGNIGGQMPPDIALSKWAHIQYSGLEGDTKAMTRMVSELGADPDVASGAIQRLQANDPQIKNVTAPEGPKPAGQNVPLAGVTPGSRAMAQLPPEVMKEVEARGTTQSLRSAVQFAKDRISIPKYRRPYVQLNATEKADIDRLYEARTSGSGRE